MPPFSGRRSRHDGLRTNKTIAHQEGTITQKRFPDIIDPTPERPDYRALQEMADHISVLPEKKIPSKMRDQLINMEIDFTYAFLPLLCPDEMGFPTGHLKPNDLKEEQKRLAPVLERAHDLLAFCAEELQQPPPDNLRHIEQILRHRLDGLERKQSQQTPKP